MGGGGYEADGRQQLKEDFFINLFTFLDFFDCRNIVPG